MMSLRIIFFLIHSHNKHFHIPFCRSGNDHLLCSRLNVKLGFLRLCIKSGGFDHIFDTQFLPGKLLRCLRSQNTFDFVTIHDENIVLFQGGRTLCGAESAAELTVNRIVL